jgi:hypothetical protein
MQNTTMQTYAMFFAFKDVIACGQYKALIKANGRALLTFEDEKWWVYGVQPGGMAATGMEIKEALVNFNKTFGGIMRDIASETDCPNEFERVARKFFDKVDKVDEELWEDARIKLREEKNVAEGLGSMKRITSDQAPTISIIVANKDIKESNIIQEEDTYSAAA